MLTCGDEQRPWVVGELDVGLARCEVYPHLPCFAVCRCVGHCVVWTGLMMARDSGVVSQVMFAKSLGGPAAIPAQTPIDVHTTDDIMGGSSKVHQDLQRRPEEHGGPRGLQKQIQDMPLFPSHLTDTAILIKRSIELSYRRGPTRGNLHYAICHGRDTNNEWPQRPGI